MYYSDKIASLKDIFGVDDLTLEDGCVIVGKRRFPIVNDVIVVLEPSKWPDMLKKMIPPDDAGKKARFEFAEDIQFTFGAEWKKFPDILAEHRDEFRLYFDLIDLESFKNKRLCDLGCGIGRWSFFLQDKCREIVLVDFSEAIFVARENLKKYNNTIFIMADINCLPLRDKFADFILCLGVLHHLPVNALDAVRRLKKHSSVLLVYLYYSLDNRPVYFKALFSFITLIRLTVSKIKSGLFRGIFTNLTTVFIYLPLIKIGGIFDRIGIHGAIPIYEGYKGKTFLRIKQDVYDRFFTSIEQRFSREEIMTLKDTFGSVIISESIPYWHFLCETTAEND
jgi:SAM-dependent methyltransferase